MQLARILFAGALLFGAGCVLPEEGEQRIESSSLEDESEAMASESQATGGASDVSMAQSRDGLEPDDPVDGNKKWVCWVCHEHKDHEDGDECPEERCYHAKHPKKAKAKDKAWKECEEEHHHGCYFKECMKSH